MTNDITEGILSKLTGVKMTSPDRWQALCPSHADKNPSLSISKDTDKVLLHCHAGCEFSDILKALGLKPEDLRLNGSKPKAQAKERVAIYDYDGFQVVRYAPKGFAQRRPDGKGNWIWNLQGITPSLYHQEEVIQAVKDGRTIFIVEGEKDVDNLHALGLVATTNPMGAGKWRDRYSDNLTGAKVVILPDRDEPGRKHAQQVAASLEGKAASVKVLELYGSGKDVSDWIADGGSREELIRLANDIPEWQPSQPEPIKKSVATLSDIRSFYGAVNFLWKPWLPVGHVTAIVGPQAVGKSYFAAYLIATITGNLSTWPDGQKAIRKASKVLFLETEEMRGAYAERWEAMGLPDECVVLPIEDGNLSYIPRLPSDYDKILELGKQESVRAVVLDSLSGGHSTDENGDGMRGIMQSLVKLAGELKAPVIVVHHLRKRNHFEADGVTLDRVRGSSTITQFCRSVIGLSKVEGGESMSTVRVESLKSSFAKPPEPFGFDITDQGLVFGSAPEVPKQQTSLEMVCEFLKMELEREPQRYGTLLEKAEANGFSKNTLYKAKAALGINVVNGLWSLP